MNFDFYPENPEGFGAFYRIIHRLCFFFFGQKLCKKGGPPMTGLLFFWTPAVSVARGVPFGVVRGPFVDFVLKLIISQGFH